MCEDEFEPVGVTWVEDDYPPEGVYKLFLTDGRELIRPMSEDFVWDDTFDGARIDSAFRKKD